VTLNVFDDILPRNLSKSQKKSPEVVAKKTVSRILVSFEEEEEEIVIPKRPNILAQGTKLMVSQDQLNKIKEKKMQQEITK